MSSQQEMDALYRQNLALGHRINSLTNENNFYRIQINNFNKLTNSINKDLYRLGLNFQNKEKPEDSAKVGPLFVISNKIKLKNMQMSIGNSIRKSQKFKQNLEGSPSLIAKEIEELEKEISLLLGHAQQLQQENYLMHEINYADEIQSINAEFEEEISSKPAVSALSKPSLEFTKKQTSKNLDFLQKEEKSKIKILNDLIERNQKLEAECRKYQKMCPRSEKQTQMKALEARELENLQREEKKLMDDIEKYGKSLNEQYAINKDYKQKIMDKKYQQNKEVKVLQEEVLKCREQVKEFKQKYKDITSNSNLQKNRQPEVKLAL